MSAPQQTTEQDGRRRRAHEGPRNHYIAFIFSLVLTLIAFAAVMAGEMNRKFVIAILLTMAALQVIMQLAYWMHMKDRGHLFPIIGLLFGGFVASSMVVMALYWAFW
ncbi:cytochrome C oxidase subunit IV [Paenibacillus swuensis]|uniref:Cytochrome C oxidase subunit IV n=1 Tax=Paenibacillus swuensis TaxID=1178515 RepID=A0A172TF22_9BACL|nr:cytochrome C oxidase subunit IV family protein [Paenibacillus swuensis]ANE45552.1 cytochrome C oxidase subunit IV [Paenibacillus swuensis]